LNTTAARKAALMRHLWRPQRFRALLKRFASASADRKAQKQKLFTADPFAQCGPQIGLRSKGEIEQRIQALRHEVETPALSQTEVDLLEALLKIKESSPYALAQLRDLVVDMPAISTAVEGFSRRLNALDAKGVDVSSLAFETSYGRSSMEYYDGFVFGFYAQNGQNGLSAIASGGRYDALTKQLGKGVTMPAVGGVIRPDLVVALRGAA
jgi:ATP phosphoribosyltransferase regulatory subunit